MQQCTHNFWFVCLLQAVIRAVPKLVLTVEGADRFLDRGELTKSFHQRIFATNLKNKLNYRVAYIRLRQSNLYCSKLLNDTNGQNVQHLFVRQLCKRVCQQVCYKNVMVQTRPAQAQATTRFTNHFLACNKTLLS
jgi:hypothetical protein